MLSVGNEEEPHAESVAAPENLRLNGSEQGSRSSKRKRSLPLWMRSENFDIGGALTASQIECVADTEHSLQLPLESDVGQYLVEECSPSPEMVDCPSICSEPLQMHTVDSMGFLCAWVPHFIRQYHPELLCDRTDSEVEDVFKIEFGKYVSQSDDFYSTQRLFDGSPLSMQSPWDEFAPKLKAFRERLIVAGTLACMKPALEYKNRAIFIQSSVALLSLCCSEASVERSYSRHKFLLTSLRNRSSPELIASEMQVAFNLSQLSQEEIHDWSIPQ
jgi:hypothetical protein